MKIQHFQEADSLDIESRANEITETRNLDENTLLELDSEGNVLAITVEHARQQTDIPHFSFEQVAA